MNVRPPSCVPLRAYQRSRRLLRSSFTPHAPAQPAAETQDTVPCDVELVLQRISECDTLEAVVEANRVSIHEQQDELCEPLVVEHSPGGINCGSAALSHSYSVALSVATRCTGGVVRRVVLLGEFQRVRLPLPRCQPQPSRRCQVTPTRLRHEHRMRARPPTHTDSEAEDGFAKLAELHPEMAELLEEVKDAAETTDGAEQQRVFDLIQYALGNAPLSKAASAVPLHVQRCLQDARRESYRPVRGPPRTVSAFSRQAANQLRYDELVGSFSAAIVLSVRVATTVPGRNEVRQHFERARDDAVRSRPQELSRRFPGMALRDVALLPKAVRVAPPPPVPLLAAVGRCCPDAGYVACRIDVNHASGRPLLRHGAVFHVQ